MDAAGIREESAVLDIACGTGVLFPFYLQRGVSSVTGADISEQMVSVCRRKYDGCQRVEVLCADAEVYPFEERYDACMVFNAFPHFCNPKALLKNLRCALKEGGTLTVAHDRGRAALDRHHEGTASQVSCGLISENELAALFEACGYTDVYQYADDGIYIVTGVKK